LLKSFTYLRKFFFSLLLLQMINISFNYVNLYNTGKSGFRHKIAINTNEIDNLLGVFLHVNIVSDMQEEGDLHHDVFLENFDLGFFVFKVSLNLPTPELPVSHVRQAARDYQNYVPTLNSPPPKLV
jgi:hypothetical protein